MSESASVSFIKFFIELGVFCLMWYGAFWTIKTAVKAAIEETKTEEE